MTLTLGKLIRDDKEITRFTFEGILKYIPGVRPLFQIEYHLFGQVQYGCVDSVSQAQFLVYKYYLNEFEKMSGKGCSVSCWCISGFYFVCLVLCLTPQSTAMVMSGRSVHLTTLLS